MASDDGDADTDDEDGRPKDRYSEPFQSRGNPFLMHRPLAS